MLVKIFIFLFSLLLIYYLFIGSKLVEGLTPIQEEDIKMIPIALKNLFRSTYIGNINDIPISTRMQINKSASRTASELKKFIINEENPNLRIDARRVWPIISKFLSDMSSLLGKNIDTTRVTPP